jgi:hypothetical protein
MNQQGDRAAGHGWCSLRLRFDDRELALLRAAEHVRGVALAHAPRPNQLRTALNLAKAGHKLAHAHAGAAVILEEGELNLLVEALHYATEQVRAAARPSDEQDARARDAVLGAFPELVERGSWRSFGLGRELDALATRLRTALKSSTS